jgi:hypothetical protein
VPVIARDRESDLCRQQRPAQRGDLGEHGVDDVDGVGAGTLLADDPRLTARGAFRERRAFSSRA